VVSEAAPKGISGRTSYLRVRLEFLRYPQVIPMLCNARRFGPPVRVTGPSACPRVDHPVSRLPPATLAPYSDSLSLRLHMSPCLALPQRSNSPAHSSIGTPSPRLLRALTACRHAVSGTLSLPSRGAFHLSLTVLVHYRSTGVFSLGEWSPRIPARFHVSGRTQVPHRSHTSFAYGALTRSGRPFQGRSTGDVIGNCVAGPAGRPVWPYNTNPA
jgi:hypothetical protein